MLDLAACQHCGGLHGVTGVLKEVLQRDYKRFCRGLTRGVAGILQEVLQGDCKRCCRGLTRGVAGSYKRCSTGITWLPDAV